MCLDLKASCSDIRWTSSTECPSWVSCFVSNYTRGLFHTGCSCALSSQVEVRVYVCVCVCVCEGYRTLPSQHLNAFAIWKVSESRGCHRLRVKHKTHHISIFCVMQIYMARKPSPCPQHLSRKFFVGTLYRDQHWNLCCLVWCPALTISGNSVLLTWFRLRKMISHPPKFTVNVPTDN